MIPAPLVNHLWQSTLFAAVAGVLTLALRRNRAAARHGLWMAASLKFLIPFSLLVSAGSWLKPLAPPPQLEQAAYAAEQLGQPFVPQVVFAKTAPERPSSALPVALFALWMCGCCFFAMSSWRRWLRVHAIIREASFLRMHGDVQIHSAPGLLEPGVFGVRKPILLLPGGIADRLSEEQLDAIITHELCHIRRRDNLWATIHMGVEAIFWFHPLVWWLGTRLVEERELACDEEVLRLGSEPQAYAEGILQVCKLYLESPSPCVSGVTGADLKQRIERIMRSSIGSALDWQRRLLLVAAGCAALIGPAAIGIFRAPVAHAQVQTSLDGPAFEVALVEPHSPDRGGRGMSLQLSQVIWTDFPLSHLMQQAFEVQAFQINGPAWLGSDGFDIIAKLPQRAADTQRHAMLRRLLAERFNLRFHLETRESSGFALEIAKGGIKAIPSEPGATAGGSTTFRSKIVAKNMTLAKFAELLSQKLERVVVDRTAVSGNYNFTVEWTPDVTPAAPGESANVDGAVGPSLFKALQEQLGLHLVSQKVPVEIIVIDHLDRTPTEK